MFSIFFQQLKPLQVNAGYFLGTYKIINEVHQCRGLHSICWPPLSFSILIGSLIRPHQSNLICFCCVGHCSMLIHSLSSIGSKTLLCTSSVCTVYAYAQVPVIELITTLCKFVYLLVIQSVGNVLQWNSFTAQVFLFDIFIIFVSLWHQRITAIINRESLSPSFVHWNWFNWKFEFIIEAM